MNVDLTVAQVQLKALRDALLALCDDWEAEADSWDGPPRVDAVSAARAYAADLRAVVTP